MTSPPPIIFSPARRRAARRRIARLQQSADPARFVIEDIVEDTIERLGFLRHEPQRALGVGDWTGALAAWLRSQGSEGTEAEAAAGLAAQAPYPVDGFDVVVSMASLDTVNDLPGALSHVRRALAPGGRALVSFP